jgi:hypothetical protein
MPDWFRKLHRRDDATPTDWSGPPAGPRVLVEEEDASIRSAIVDALHDAGFQAAECAGPGHDHERRCPMVDGRGCDAVDHAAIVLQRFAPSDEALAEVRAAIAEGSPDTPVVVCSPPLTRRSVVVAVAEVS